MDSLTYFGKLLGVLGILSITLGMFSKKEVHQDVLFVLGGLSLLMYSVFKGDVIFIALQLIFIAAALYEIWEIGGQGAKDGARENKNGKKK